MGDFAGFDARRLAVCSAVFAKADQLGFLLNKYNVELLPLIDQDEGTEWYAINMIYVPNCIDREKSMFSIKPYKRKLEFFPKRILQQNVFSVWWPESSRGKIFCWEENKDPHSEFKACVERSGLRGLEFDLLWDEEKGGRAFVATLDPQKGLVRRSENEQQ